MMLRMPKFSMMRRLSRSAPAPMDSMAMTAPTPKIMPSMVRNERIFRRPRLLTATLIVSQFTNIGITVYPSNSVSANCLRINA